MNRPIRFRAWDIDVKRMIYDVMYKTGSVIRIGSENWIPKTRLDGSSCTEVMQYTGLKDKNGREIYEGDIVNAVFRDGSKYERPHEVYFEQGSFNVGMGCLNDIYTRDIEVIGNIYANPELIK